MTNDPFIVYNLFNPRFPKEVLGIRDRHKEALADVTADPVIGSTKLFTRDLQKALVLAHSPEPVSPSTPAYEVAVSRGSKVPNFITLARHITDCENDLPRLVSITKQMASYENRGDEGEYNPLPTEVLTMPYIGSLTGIGSTYLRLFREITKSFDDIRADISSRQVVENGVRFVKDTLTELLDFSAPEIGTYSKSYLVPALDYDLALVEATSRTSESLGEILSLLSEVEQLNADYLALHAKFLGMIDEDALLSHLNLLCAHTVDSEVHIIEQSIAEIEAMAYALEITAMANDPIGFAAMMDKGGPEILTIMDRVLTDFYARYDTVLPVEDDPGPPISGDGTGGGDDDDCPCC